MYSNYWFRGANRSLELTSLLDSHNMLGFWPLVGIRSLSKRAWCKCSAMILLWLCVTNLCGTSSSDSPIDTHKLILQPSAHKVIMQSPKKSNACDKNDPPSSWWAPLWFGPLSPLSAPLKGSCHYGPAEEQTSPLHSRARRENLQLPRGCEALSAAKWQGRACSAAQFWGACIPPTLQLTHCWLRGGGRAHRRENK